MSPNGSRPSREIHETLTPSRASATAKFDSAPAKRSVNDVPGPGTPLPSGSSSVIVSPAVKTDIDVF